VFHEMWCFVKKLRNQKKKKITHFLLNTNLAYLTIVYDTVHIRIFIGTFHLVTNTSRYADFYFIYDGPQNRPYLLESKMTVI
jgi:hypothetical protein